MTSEPSGILHASSPSFSLSEIHADGGLTPPLAELQVGDKAMSGHCTGVADTVGIITSLVAPSQLVDPDPDDPALMPQSHGLPFAGGS